MELRKQEIKKRKKRKGKFRTGKLLQFFLDQKAMKMSILSTTGHIKLMSRTLRFYNLKSYILSQTFLLLINIYLLTQKIICSWETNMPSSKLIFKRMKNTNQ